MASEDHGPRKMGVYEGAGTVRSQSRTLIIAAFVIAVLAILLVWLI
ncbi:MAG TPA: hypothetical protein VD995_08670 [Azospirillum sp.]|nr:hypothetical protein [Azospirillum sp.]